jgi:hypothetical protein
MLQRAITVLTPSSRLLFLTALVVAACSSTGQEGGSEQTTGGGNLAGNLADGGAGAAPSGGSPSGGGGISNVGGDEQGGAVVGGSGGMGGDPDVPCGVGTELPAWDPSSDVCYPTCIAQGFGWTKPDGQCFNWGVSLCTIYNGGGAADFLNHFGDSCDCTVTGNMATVWDAAGGLFGSVCTEGGSLQATQGADGCPIFTLDFDYQGTVYNGAWICQMAF